MAMIKAQLGLAEEAFTRHREPPAGASPPWLRPKVRVSRDKLMLAYAVS